MRAARKGLRDVVRRHRRGAGSSLHRYTEGSGACRHWPTLYPRLQYSPLNHGPGAPAGLSEPTRQVQQSSVIRWNSIRPESG